MSAAALRRIPLACLVLVGATACVVSCSSRTRDDTAPAASAPPARIPPGLATEPCNVDQDCAPLNCCFALEPTSCIPRQRAHCDALEVKCTPFDGPHFDCACVEHACAGKPVAAGTLWTPDAGAPAATTAEWAMGELKQPAILGVIIQRGADVKTCRALGKNPNGVVVMRWTVLASGTVERPTVTASTVPGAAVSTCLAKKIGAWRFPKSKGKTQVTYRFQFGR